MDPEIVLEDADLLIAYKPAGLATQSARLSQPDLFRILKKHTPYVALIGRLDQPVEGLVLAAKNRETAAALSAQQQAHRIRKKYFCAVSAAEDFPESGTLSDELIHDRNSRRAIVVSEKTKGAKRAELSYRTIAEEDGVRLLEIDLMTGRFHQIRAQMSYHGAPLIGDGRYGGAPCEEKGCGIALCAFCLSFQHPVTGKQTDVRIAPRHPLLRRLMNGQIS